MLIYDIFMNMVVLLELDISMANHIYYYIVTKFQNDGKVIQISTKSRWTRVEY